MTIVILTFVFSLRFIFQISIITICYLGWKISKLCFLKKVEGGRKEGRKGGRGGGKTPHKMRKDRLFLHGSKIAD